MVGRDVEHLEVGVVVLDLRAFVDHEPELGEDVGDLARRLDDRVQGAAPDRAAGRRDVDPLSAARRAASSRAAEPLRASASAASTAAADLVGDRADLRAVLRGQRADAAQDRGQLALLAQDLELEGVEGRGVGRRRRGRDASSRSASRSAVSWARSTGVRPWVGGLLENRRTLDR